MKRSVMLLSAAATCLTLGATAAKAAPEGRWVLNPLKCPDLVEDWRDRRESRIDEAYDRIRYDVREDRRDRRESRRDEAVTQCPARAWEWQGPAYSKRLHPARPARVRVFYDFEKRRYFRRNGDTVIVIKVPD